nr:uncharacterized protein CTRU02_02163 [Colletotrichum truncatum]KAF6799292.1 hypothetical protein CTRU02_02163 [Colletotrichum truncatum]
MFQVQPQRRLEAQIRGPAQHALRLACPGSHMLFQVGCNRVEEWIFLRLSLPAPLCLLYISQTLDGPRRI